jgi:sugar phosphate isomerase/epimerase
VSSVSTRREFIKQSVASGIAAALPPFSIAAAAPVPVGLQLYTLKAELAKDFEATLQQVAKIGIRQVELIHFPDREPAEVARALRNAGLQAVSLHAKPGLAREAQVQIDAASELGVQYLIAAIPEFSGPVRFESIVAMTRDDWRWNAQLFNSIGERASRSSIRFGYHNHHFEFKRFDDVCIYDELLRCTDPELVVMELDCGWAEYAGADAAQYLRSYPGRFPLLHLKDIKSRASAHAGLQLAGTEVGRGIIDWAEVFSAAEAAGVKHAFIEQEPPFERPALEAVRMSYEWLRARR